MRNEKKIVEEIEAIGLTAKVLEPGLAVYPNNDSNIMYTTRLDKLLAVAQKYNLRHYISFREGFVRLF